MNEFISGAKTLTKFTQALDAGFRELQIENPGWELVQIHASPLSRVEDLTILQAARKSDTKKIFLIHRPDELLFYPELLEYFIQHPETQIVLLGDLALSLEFWNSRRRFIHIIPHPYLELGLPSLVQNKYVIGSFTSWGEMRKLEHFFSLSEEISQSALADKVHLLVGGTLDGQPLKQQDLPSMVSFSPDFFLPHFNVQLYHLMGKKRIGESSGSLHRGISVPVIFEANGMERTEGVRVIKIESDADLIQIDFKQTVQNISVFLDEIDQHLSFNLERAKLNLPRHFVKKLLEIKG